MVTPTDSLSDVRKNLKVRWYRCPIDRAVLRELMQPNDPQGWLQAGGHLIIFAATGGLTLYLFSQQMWLGFALALFAHGTSASFFKGIAAHELGHGSVFKTRWLNQFFLRLFSLISWHNHHEYQCGPDHQCCHAADRVCDPAARDADDAEDPAHQHIVTPGGMDKTP